MRVIESPTDGAVVSAPTDEELVGALRRHIQQQDPDATFTDEQLRELVERHAYDALDS
jgi:hypothetical protein